MADLTFCWVVTLKVVLYQLSEVWQHIVRFPNPLATGSGLGFQCPKKWELFLWGLLAQPFGDAQGWVVAYWVRTDLSSLWHQHWSSTFTQCSCSRAFMSSAQSSLRPPPNPHFVFSWFSTCISHFYLHDISNVHKLMDKEQFRDPNQTKPCCAHAAISCGLAVWKTNSETDLWSEPVSDFAFSHIVFLFLQNW